MKNHILFENANLDLATGKIYGLIGKEGTGETTLLKLLSGLERDDHKKWINLFPDHYCPIGIHLDSPKLYPYLSGKQNIQFFTSDLSTFYYEPDILVEKLHLETIIDKKVKTYSPETKQKLSLIIAILMAEKLLLLDKPINGLDEESIQTVQSILLYLSKVHGLTILLTMKDEHEWKEVLDKRLTIKNGSFLTVDLEREKSL